MPVPPQWIECDTLETKQFIAAVRDEDFAPLFDGAAYELWKRRTRFFDGYEHYMLCNKASLPYFTLEYISNGENHYYLDGSEHPLELLVQKGALRLNERNIMEYVEFHSDVTFYPYRKVKFITDPENAPYSGASAMKHHFKTQKYAAKFDMTYSEEYQAFYITMPVLYNGETVKGYVQVLKTGEINILEPVNIPLMDGKRDHAPLHYSHPHEQDVLQANLDILLLSAEGKRLYETIINHGGRLKILSGVGSAAFAASSTLGYIVVPQNLETASPYQVIAMAGTLREMELQLMDEKRPDPFDTTHEALEQHCALNLDILLEICTIGDELAEAGFDDIIRKFKKSGFSDIYSGYKNKAPMDDLVFMLGKHLNIEVKV